MDRGHTQMPDTMSNSNVEINKALLTIHQTVVKHKEILDEMLNEMIPEMTRRHNQVVDVLNQLKNVVEHKPSVPARQNVASGSQPYSLIDIQTHYDNKIEALEKKLVEKSNENKKLHKIMQSGQTMVSLSDEQVEKDFTKLYHKIEQYCRTYMAPSYKEKQDMKENDKILRWQSMVTASLCQDIFSRETFGACSSIDDHLEKAEMELKKKVSSNAIALWRAQTSKLTNLMIPTNRDDLMRRGANNLFEDLYNTSPVRSENAYEALYNLYDDVCGLALTLRKSGIAFQWSCGAPTDNRDEYYISMPGYMETANNGHPVICRVLFGPVLKVTDQNRVVIRKGTLLTRANG